MHTHTYIYLHTIDNLKMPISQQHMTSDWEKEKTGYPEEMVEMGIKPTTLEEWGDLPNHCAPEDV